MKAIMNEQYEHAQILAEVIPHFHIFKILLLGMYVNKPKYFFCLIDPLKSAVGVSVVIVVCRCYSYQCLHSQPLC